MEIRVEGLSKNFADTAVLKNIFLSVKDGEFVGIIGPNGSGKSTLLKCIYRVLEFEHGAVWLGGDELKKLSVKESARRQAVLAQHNTFSFDLSVREIVLMGRSPYKHFLEQNSREDYAIVQQALTEVGLAGYAEHSYASLSGGEQQRVMLARALAQRTPCLLLDEPTNHLDIKYQLQLMDHVRRMPLTLVAALHDLNIAAAYCDRLVAMKNGRILAAGSPRELLTEKFIYTLYEVHAQVLHLSDGGVVIAYRPQTSGD